MAGGQSVRHILSQPDVDTTWMLSLNCRTPAAGTGTDEAQAATTQTLAAAQTPSSSASSPVATWEALEGHEGLAIKQNHQVSYVTWHARGGYFASVAPTGTCLFSLVAISCN